MLDSGLPSPFFFTVIQALALLLVSAGALGVGLLSSLMIDQFVMPNTRALWRRPHGAVCIHVGLWLIVFVIEFMQFQRLWLSAFMATTIQCVLVMIHHAKYAVLREPFIYQDVQYFVDACRFPRLYIPFFGWGRLLVSLGLFTFGLLVVLQLETPITSQFGLWSTVMWLLCVVTLGSALIVLGSRPVIGLSFKPQEDIARFGFLTTLWLYFLAERQVTPELTGLSSLKAAVQSPRSHSLELGESSLHASSLDLPHVIVVQSESFFDIRRWCTAVDSAVLAHFDRVCSQSLHCGVMSVPAWGANTVRTEFSFLTGIALERLGIDRFNPYRRGVSKQTPSLARFYQQLGYRTIAIHPYLGKFYRRDQLFPLFGFDRLIDINEFEPPKGDQPYVGDLAVTQKVESLLQEHSSKGDTQPLFIFVITMENHGPLHLETLSAEAAVRWLVSDLPEGCSDIAVYLRHLANADAMIERLTTVLSESAGSKNTLSPKQTRPGVLCWYGDHVPMMGKAYAALGMPDGCTDYFIWRSDLTPSVARKPTDLSIDQLGQILLQTASAPLQGWRSAK